MNNEFLTLLDSIADKYNVTSGEVYREIQKAIDMAYDNPNPEVKLAWLDVPFEGERPTAKDVIIALRDKIIDDM